VQPIREHGDQRSICRGRNRRPSPVEAILISRGATLSLDLLDHEGAKQGLGARLGVQRRSPASAVVEMAGGDYAGRTTLADRRYHRND